MNGKTKFYEISKQWGMGIWEDDPKVLRINMPDAKLNKKQISRLIRRLKEARKILKEHRMKEGADHG